MVTVSVEGNVQGKYPEPFYRLRKIPLNLNGFHQD